MLECVIVYYTVYAEIFATCSHWRNFYHANFLSCVNDYIEDMATFTAWRKFIFLQYKGIWGWRNFCQAKIFTYTVLSGAHELVCAVVQCTININLTVHTHTHTVLFCQPLSYAFPHICFSGDHESIGSLMKIAINSFLTTEPCFYKINIFFPNVSGVHIICSACEFNRL